MLECGYCTHLKRMTQLVHVIVKGRHISEYIKSLKYFQNVRNEHENIFVSYAFKLLTLEGTRGTFVFFYNTLTL